MIVQPGVQNHGNERMDVSMEDHVSRIKKNLDCNPPPRVLFA